MSTDHWYLLPVGFAIAVLAMFSGISAGNFWVPVYRLWARFEPPVAFWMTLATMLCGYGSGVVRNLRQETLDRHIIIHHLPFTIPAALVGGYLAPVLNIPWLVLLCRTLRAGLWRAYLGAFAAGGYPDAGAFRRTGRLHPLEAPAS